MGTLILLIIIVLLFLWGLKEYYQIKLGVSPQGSPKQVANELISLCKDLDGSGTFLDVGSGWGSMVIPMSKALPDWQFYGLEDSPTPWLVSQFRTAKSNAANINLFLGNAEKFRYRGYDIIYLNIPKKLLNEITPPLLRNIDRGSLVVTYRNKLDGMDPFNNLLIKDDQGFERQVYLYAKTAAAEQPAPQQAQPSAEPKQQAKLPHERHIDEPAATPDLELEEKPAETPQAEKQEKQPDQK